MSKKITERRLTIDVEEAGNAVGLGRDAAYRAVHSGDIPSIRVGRRILVPVGRLAEMLGTSPEAILAGGEVGK